MSSEGKQKSTGSLDLWVDVPATALWFEPGVHCDGSTTIQITATSGTWTSNPQNGKLFGPGGNRLYVAKEGYNLPGIYEGTLVGRVGEDSSGVFEIGHSTTCVPSGMVGTLYLSINDDMYQRYGAGFTDNVGAVTVRIWTPGSGGSSGW